MKRIFVYNPKSGSAPPRRALQNIMKREELSVDSWVALDEHYDKKITKILDAQTEVYVCGGDGTISTVAADVIASGAVLVPIPGGTLNHFTKDLGIEQDVGEAIRTMKRARITSVDVGSVNDRYFLNNSSIGMYARSLAVRERLDNTFHKWVSAAVAVCKELYHFRSYTIQLDGRKIRTPLIFVGNNEYRLDQGEFGNRTKLDEGILSLVVSQHESRARLFFDIIQIGLRGSFDSNELLITKTNKVTLGLKKRAINVSVDGERILMSAPLVYRVHEKALRIRLPK